MQGFEHLMLPPTDGVKASCTACRTVITANHGTWIHIINGVGYPYCPTLRAASTQKVFLQ